MRSAALLLLLVLGGCSCSADLRGAAVELRAAVDDLADTSMARPGIDLDAWADLVDAAKDAARALEERTR
ncbi:MAG: hypothetical protein KF878_09760 [Planctomycetes bacterium]|nr:hypothetical protein [Planctomycetota bacterium]